MAKLSKGNKAVLLTQVTVSAVSIAIAFAMDASATGPNVIHSAVWNVIGGLFLSIVPGAAITFATALSYSNE